MTVSNLTLNGDNEPTSGEWSYAGPETVDYLIVKAGKNYAVYDYTATNGVMPNMGIWDTSGVGNKGMSHITAYTTSVPEPSSGLMFAVSACGISLIRKRR